MMPAPFPVDATLIELAYTVTVWVQPSNYALLELIRDSHGRESVHDIVKAEVQSSLASLCYVTDTMVERKSE